MFSIFTTRENRLPVAFLEHFRTSSLCWTLVAPGGSGRAPVASFLPQHHGAASAWIAKAQKQRRNVLALMAESYGAVSAVKLVRGHLRGSRHFGVKLSTAKAEALEAFRPAPFLRLEAGQRIYVAWRLFNECSIEAVEATANAVAAKLGGVSIGHLLPIAGTVHEGARVQLIHLLKDRLNVLTDFAAVEASTEGRAFVRASDVQAKPLSWLWRGAVLRGALSIAFGAGGVGKSTIAATIAATITNGGRFPDGEQATPGGVIFCEGEDDPERVTLPRLVAAGADLSRLVLGPVCDISQGVGALDGAVKALGEVPALLVLSPIKSFFGPESYIDTEVRARLAPVLAWAEKHNIAVLGVAHPRKDKDQMSGAGAWTNTARAGLLVKREKHSRVLSPLKANSGRDDWKLSYMLEGVELPGGIETSRVVWQSSESETQPVSSVVCRTQLSDVDSWLAGALARGPRDSVELKVEAKRRAISTGSLYRAVKRLDVTIDKASKTWSL